MTGSVQGFATKFVIGLGAVAGVAMAFALVQELVEGLTRLHAETGPGDRIADLARQRVVEQVGDVVLERAGVRCEHDDGHEPDRSPGEAERPPDAPRRRDRPRQLHRDPRPRAGRRAVFHGAIGYLLLDDAAYNRARKTNRGNPYKDEILDLQPVDERFRGDLGNLCGPCARADREYEAGNADGAEQHGAWCACDLHAIDPP